MEAMSVEQEQVNSQATYEETEQVLSNINSIRILQTMANNITI